MLATFATIRPAAAHPLGNNSITHFSVLYVLPDRVEIDFYLDIAEDPARYIEMTEMDDDGDSQVTREEQETWLEEKAAEYREHMHLKVDGRTLPVELIPEERDPKTDRKLVTSKIILPVLGPMGMTYRLVIRYVARYPQAPGPGMYALDYEDRTYSQQTGLKRILLEHTSRIGTLNPKLKSTLADGPVSEALRTALAGQGLSLPVADAVVLTSIAAAEDGQSRWLIRDATRTFLLVAEPKGLGLYRTPLIEILPPHPVFWSAEDDPFRYEQYDPAKLPDERKTSFRFRIHAMPEALAPQAPADPRVAVTTGPAVVASRPAEPAEIAAVVTPPPAPAATAPAEPEATAMISTRPATPSDESARVARTTNFLDPAKNPSLTSQNQRQSERMLALLKGDWGLPMFLTVTLLSFGWGAAHALMPGHAKTLVAAYLISQRGTYWHAIVLAIIVTITHTALVVVMGLIVHYYKESNPDLGPSLQLWLGIIAGLLVAGMGLTLIWRALRGGIGHHHHDHDHHHHDHHDHDDRSWLRKLFTHSHPHLPVHAHVHVHADAHAHALDHEHGHSHSHDHGHIHDHEHSHEHGHSHELEHNHQHGQVHAHASGHDHTHDQYHDHGHAHEHQPQGHGHASHRPADEEPLSYRTLLILGITGGIVPCPTATIIMLLGIGANVVLGALYAVGVFSLGLALTLMAVGSLALFSRRFAAKVMSDTQQEGELSGAGRRVLLQFVPALSGLAVIALGSAITAHYVHLLRTGQGLFAWMG